MIRANLSQVAQSSMDAVVLLARQALLTLKFSSRPSQGSALSAMRFVTSTTDLMGEMGPLVNLDHFQLALAFTWGEWRLIRLSETSGGTT